MGLHALFDALLAEMYGNSVLAFVMATITSPPTRCCTTFAITPYLYALQG
jgi:hypothetical protein